jgi:hypothetical protein
VGNRAVAQALTTIQRAGPAPTPFDAGSPLEGGELGVTRVVGGQLPSFHVDLDDAPGGRVAKVDATTEGSTDISARYVGPGLHPWGTTEDGRPRQLLVPDAVSQQARAGEQEHADDYWWTHRLVAGEAARAINVLAALPARPAADIRAAGQMWREALHDTISAKLRITADASDPASGGTVTEPWNRARAALFQSTLGRDTNGWHSFSSREPTAAERQANPVPDGTTLKVAAIGGAIGQHPSEARMRAAFDALPDRP